MLIGRLKRRCQRGHQGTAVRLNRIKSPYSNQRFDAAFVDCATIDAAAKVEQTGKWSSLASTQNFFDGPLPCTLDGPHAIVNRTGRQTFLRCGIRHRFKPIGRGIDIGRQHRNAIGQTIAPKNLYFVGIVHVRR